MTESNMSVITLLPGGGAMIGTPGPALKAELTIYQRINAVMVDVKTVSKERFQKFDKFHYVGHDDVTDPLHDAFVKHGIFQHVILGDHRRRDDQDSGL